MTKQGTYQSTGYQPYPTGGSAAVTNFVKPSDELTTSAGYLSIIGGFTIITMTTPTGYSAPNSAGHSTTTSGHVTSETDAVVPPAKRQAHPTPAAPAVRARQAPTSPEMVEVVRSSSSSGAQSIASSAERARRLALARTKQETARRNLELAQASQELAEGELE